MHQKGSDPSQEGFEVGNGATALHAAVENGHIDTVRLMFKHGVKQLGTVRVFNHGFCRVRVSSIGLRLLFGARFSTGIYTRGCH
jgi:ankyrin repeat protein